MEEKSLKQISFEQICEWIPDWKKLALEDITMKKMTGITNRTFRVQHKNQEVSPQTILLRVFGHDVDGIFIDRTEEVVVYQTVAEDGLGPKVYGHSLQMRAEEWIESEVLQQSEMQQEFHRRKVALLLYKFHQQNVDHICTQPLPLKVLNNRVSIKTAVNKYHEKQNLYTEEDHKKIKEILKLWTSEEEIEFLKSEMPKSEESKVFSHNDLLANNVLINKERQFFFIDFEYSSYNYRTYDIGNYFMESQWNYEITEPPFFHIDDEPVDIEKIRDMIKYYALYAVCPEMITADIDENKLVEDEEFFKSFLVGKEQAHEKLVDEMVKEVPLFMMFSNYFWGIWGIVMSKNPEIEFDYVEYSFNKYKKYCQVKETYYPQKYKQQQQQATVEQSNN